MRARDGEITNLMKEGRGLLLHKKEWNRLKKHLDPPEEPSALEEQKQYVNSLTEKSRAWMKTWPDSELGRIEIHEKEKRDQRKADIAAVKEFIEKRNNKERIHNANVIQKAKEKIFYESCYGKKLVSALLESKTLEERNIQVEFLKELKEKNTINDIIDPFCTFGLDKRADDETKCRKTVAVQTAQENKKIYEEQIALEAEAKKAKKYADLENTHLMKQLLRLEGKAEEKVRLIQKQSFEEYISLHNKYKQERAKREAEQQAMIEKCFKEKEELNCKIKKALQKIQQKAKDMPWSKAAYDTIKQNQEEERKRIEAFEEKSIKEHEYRVAEQDRQALEKKKHDIKNNLAIAETNRAMAELEKQRQDTSQSKCFCDRQSLILKSDKMPLRKEEDGTKEPHFPCFCASNKLSCELKERINEQPSWTGMKAKNDEFARHADETLRECKYKLPGRKVVDEYKKYNGVPQLDVPNYY